MNKIAIICPYFGKFPNNINFTLNSMNNNKEIDWYIFTDNINEEKYNNIFFIKYSFEEMKRLIQEKLGTKINYVYKLCDYKPTYGYLFENYIEKYEFWGYCDLDVIFGDISKFINNEILKKYDKIYELGHFSLYKNNEKMRRAFMDIENENKSYLDVFNSDIIYVFDEAYHLYDLPQNGINGIIEKMRWKNI